MKYVIYNTSVFDLDITKDDYVEVLVKKGVNIKINERINCNTNIRIILEENAVVKYLSVDFSSETKREIVIDRNASLSLIHAILSDEKAEKETNAYLTSMDASINIKTIIIGKNMISNNKISIYHQAKNTNSLIDNYLIANETKINMEVLGKIEKGMSKSNCSQHSRGIIISDNSKISVLPILLIDEFDVLANHGASIGKIDEEGLYYLMSRGISKKDAEALIIGGFLNPILKEIDNEEFKNQLVEIANCRL